MSPNGIGFALLLLGVFLLAAKWIRVRVGLAQRLFLPASIIGGFLGLLVGPNILGAVTSLFGSDALAEGGLLGTDVLAVWRTLPALLISVVFATLFLGQRIPSPARVAKLVGPQLSVGVAFGSGQYVVGLLLAVAILVPLFGMSPMAGALIEIGFEGGHGTAAGMRPVLEELGFADGADLALGLATVGIVSGIVIGVALVNWAVRTGRTSFLDAKVEMSAEEKKGLFHKDDRQPAAMMTTRPSSVEPLALHFGFIAVAILLGWLLLNGLKRLEQLLWADTVELLAHVPLFPLAMLGGVLVQLVLDRTGNDHILDHQMMLRIQGLALDLLIISALSTLSLTAIANNLGPFLVLAVGGIAFNVFVMLVLVPRIIPQYWFERGIGDFGQSMGVTATGLILMRIADPEAKSPAFEAFGYKQLIFEPFFGGGLVTAAAIPLIYQFGPTPLLLGMTAIFAVAVTVGLKYFGKQKWTVQGTPGEEDGKKAAATVE